APARRCAATGRPAPRPGDEPQVCRCRTCRRVASAGRVEVQPAYARFLHRSPSFVRCPGIIGRTRRI
ncbi:MAG: hypothetical protein AVDCRST_MAG64-2442, partial [uncultured Phycisphaerae bacterium]